jgi:thioredoxin reductase (NADPH)
VFLSGVASTVHVMVRGPGLAATMSRYLVERLGAIPNIVLHTRTELVELRGTPDQGLAGVRWRNNDSQAESEAAIRNVFLFVGADPATSWLAGCDVALDASGFVLTGSVDVGQSALQTSVAGVFAIGDVRSGSVKRVGNAIGEGAQVVAALHQYLSGSSQAVA